MLSLPIINHCGVFTPFAITSVQGAAVFTADILGGGLKYVMFTPWGFMIQFDRFLHIFQMGWLMKNHQVVGPGDDSWWLNQRWFLLQDGQRDSASVTFRIVGDPVPKIPLKRKFRSGPKNLWCESHASYMCSDSNIIRMLVFHSLSYF